MDHAAIRKPYSRRVGGTRIGARSIATGRFRMNTNPGVNQCEHRGKQRLTTSAPATIRKHKTPRGKSMLNLADSFKPEMKSNLETTAIR
jgi:hypothetical protein